jgi:hypothetical protein
VKALVVETTGGAEHSTTGGPVTATLFGAPETMVNSRMRPRRGLQLVLSILVALSALSSGCAHDLVDGDRLRPVSKRRIEDDTARRRRLPFLRDVPGVVFSAQETDAFVASLAPTPEQDTLYTRVNQKLGIQPDGLTYGEIQAEFLRSGVAAIYMPDQGKMAVFENPLLDQAAILNLPVDVMTGRSSVHGLIVSHEYVHALQDQHFDLSRLVPASLYMEDEDRALAKKSLIETEANIVSYAHAYGMDLERVLQRKGLVVMLEVNGMIADLTTKAMVGGVPAFIRESTVRQYDAALRFIDRAMQNGGFAGLNQVYVDGGPESTEQLLWPEKYFDERDDPTPIARDVGLPGIAPDARLYGSSFGELQWRVLLSLAQGSSDGERAAKGWDGDRYEVWDLGERTLLTFRTTWDSEDDAREMYDALVRLVTETRHPGRTSAVVEDTALADGEARSRFHVRPTSPGEEGVRAHVDEEVVVWRSGAHVVFVDGAVPGTSIALGEALLASLATGAPPVEALAPVMMPVSLPPTTSAHPLADQVTLDSRTLELMMSSHVQLDDTGLLSFSIIPNIGMRWAFRDGIELAFPFVLTLPMFKTEQHTLAVTAGITDFGRLSSTLPFALVTVPSEVGFALTHQTRFFDTVAVTGQLSTRTRAPLETPVGFDLRAGGAFSISLFRRLTVNVGAAYLDDLSAVAQQSLAFLDEKPTVARRHRHVLLGSALERSFMTMPLLELRVLGGIHLVFSSSVLVDVDAIALRSQRHELGVLLRF